MKIKKKYAPLLSAMIMGSIMAFIMSGIVTAINLGGITDDFVSKWLNSFSIVVFIVIPIIMTVRPIVEKLMKKLIDINS